MAEMSLAELFKVMFGDCLDHKHEQVGRCVYCKPCGRRLYQGTVMTADDIASVREVIALADPGNPDA